MRASSNELIEHFRCPDHVRRELRLAGGDNPFGEPMFRCVWGYDRIVPITGQWEKWEQFAATLTDKVTGFSEVRHFTKCTGTVVETRMLPKYLPGNCWHLEMWRPAEEYGSPEQWRKAGEEVLQGMTIDTAGPYPERGEYELCYPLTHDCTSSGQPIPLVMQVLADICNMIRAGGPGAFTLAQRKAAIEQRERLRDEGFVKRTEAILKDGIPAFSGKEFVVVPQIIKP